MQSALFKSFLFLDAEFKYLCVRHPHKIIIGAGLKNSPSDKVVPHLKEKLKVQTPHRSSADAGPLVLRRVIEPPESNSPHNEVAPDSKGSEF